MSERSSRVLIVEDDASLREALVLVLRAEGYEVVAEADGWNVTAILESFRPDVAVLDVWLPEGPDGLEIARLLRNRSDLPILFLTAADSLEDRLAGFEAGGDDYLTKPFSMSELLVRLHALLRRAGRLSSTVRQVGDVVIDRDAHSVTRAGVEVELTPTEFELLFTFARQPGRVFSKTRLLGMVWGYEMYDHNVVEVHVSALRRKLEALGPRVIHTVRGVGYVLRT